MMGGDDEEEEEGEKEECTKSVWFVAAASAPLETLFQRTSCLYHLQVSWLLDFPPVQGIHQVPAVIPTWGPRESPMKQVSSITGCYNTVSPLDYWFLQRSTRWVSPVGSGQSCTHAGPLPPVLSYQQHWESRHGPRPGLRSCEPLSDVNTGG